MSLRFRRLGYRMYAEGRALLAMVVAPWCTTLRTALALAPRIWPIPQWARAVWTLRDVGVGRVVR